VSGTAYGLSTAFGSFDNTFTGNTLTACTRGVGLGDSRHSAVVGNTIRNCGQTGNNTAHSITVVGCHDGLIANNNIAAGLQDGIHFYYTSSSGFSLLDNHIVDHGGTGIAFAGAASDMTIRGNRIVSASGPGISNYPSLSGDICDNTILRPGADGIHVNQYSAGLLRGNRVEGAGRHGIVLRDSTGNSVVGNIIRNCGGFAFFFDGNATSRLNSIHDNLLTGNQGGRFELPLTDPPDTTVEFPQGFTLYNTEPAPDAPLGWRCIETGPGRLGNWLAFGEAGTE